MAVLLTKRGCEGRLVGKRAVLLTDWADGEVKDRETTEKTNPVSKLRRGFRRYLPSKSPCLIVDFYSIKVDKSELGRSIVDCKNSRHINGFPIG